MYIKKYTKEAFGKSRIPDSRSNFERGREREIDGNKKQT